MLAKNATYKKQRDELKISQFQMQQPKTDYLQFSLIMANQSSNNNIENISNCKLKLTI